MYTLTLLLRLGLILFGNPIEPDIGSRSSYYTDHNNVGMLVLGSANQQTLIERVELAHSLYLSKNGQFDYIIVSGGCGAHGSQICEAGQMKDLLMEKGIPEHIIIKEEKSKTTAQNYCYSRILRNPDGTKVINKDDTLYVVSNHWHAIAVAGCFSVREDVKGTYYIEGDIKPKSNDSVDYTHILENCSNNQNYCEDLLWPYITASYFRNLDGQNEVVHLLGDHVAYSDSKASESSFFLTKKNHHPVVPKKWQDQIDAAFYNRTENKIYFLMGGHSISFGPDEKFNEDRLMPLKKWIKDLPTTWQNGNIDAAFITNDDHKLYLLKGSGLLTVSIPDMTIVNFDDKISNRYQGWPFSWKNGNVDAAYYDEISNKLFLFRGKEYIRISWNDNKTVDSGYPKSLPIKKP
ncbi:hypothetical protein F8C76_01800 [Flagellimonas olearia]|uniref:DUF218 domain-containing protein n=1 Tax=Flagellimonas olearia TaxID=552546 RepID=A0A6I1DXL3_9FLAO|nr:ElyC/SanA/YdcF family protein [Allomuricauda olearia]KAB7530266.1 hypothetical protein F8C76_01800 [Allomuricauda olearia]